MVLMVDNYDPKTYEVLPLIHEAKAHFDRSVNDSDITRLGEIFIEYNMQDKYGLMLRVFRL